MSVKPPRCADKFLTWYCRADLLEEIQGDAYELFKRTHQENQSKAKRQFVWNVFRFFRLKNIKRSKSNYSNNAISMLKSYFISGFRNISRNVTHATINIAGLAIAIACCISIFLLIDSFYNLDAFHKNGARIYLLMSKVKIGDETENWARTPYLLGPALKDENASVESMVRIQKMGDLSIRYETHVFNETLWGVDSTFFDVFSYPILQGSSNPLSDKNNIVISSEKAIQYFGEGNALGKELSVKFSDNKIQTFTVSAVADNMIDKSSMRFTFLIPISNYEDQKGKNNIDWAAWARSTFVLLKDQHHPSDFVNSLTSYQKLQNEANPRFELRDVEWIPLQEVSARSYDIVDCLSWDLHPVTLIVVSIIVLFLLLLACFNYMNVAIASVSLRLKEIGIRKVIGGSKRQVILQYMTENFMLCSLAIVSGTGIAYFFMVPAFNSLYPINVPFAFSSLNTMILFFGGTLLFTTLLSGAYPSFYVSSFNSLSILKGKEKFGGKSLLSKTMLGLQFVISFTTIVFSLLSVSNRDYFKKKDWGYQQQDVAYIPIHGKEQFFALRDLVSQQKNVVAYAGSESHIGDDDELTNVQSPEKDIQVNRFPIGFNYIETMGIQLKEGRLFNAATESDKQTSVLVNEAFVKKMGWSDPLDRQVTFNGGTYFIIGVVYNFYFKDFDKILEPALLNIVSEDQYNFFVVKSTVGTLDQITGLIQKSWPSIAPDDAYLGHSQQEVFRSFYHDTESDSKIMYFISLIALALACMGLFGLISYNLSRRMKEFSIRKIFGAGIPHIFRLMSQEYMIIVLAAFMIGSAIGYYLMAQLHEAVYPDKMPLPQWPLVVTISMMVISVLLTVASQVYRVVKENPVDTLRSE